MEGAGSRKYKLVETSADGEQRVIRDLQTPVPVVVGSKRIRRSPQ